jgi:late competence protein required for DNA uptake (superfamily II DNA/RNA helicase)
MADMGNQGPPPADKNIINNLPEVNVHEIKAQTGEEPKCTICCEKIPEKATKLPCGHLYDRECITTWLE